MFIVDFTSIINALEYRMCANLRRAKAEFVFIIFKKSESLPAQKVKKKCRKISIEGRQTVLPP